MDNTEFLEVSGVEVSKVEEYARFVVSGEMPESGSVAECKAEFECAAKMRDKLNSTLEKLYAMPDDQLTQTLRAVGEFEADEKLVAYTPETLSRLINEAYDKNFYVSVELPRRCGYEIVLRVSFEHGTVCHWCNICGIERSREDYDSNLHLPTVCAEHLEKLCKMLD